MGQESRDREEWKCIAASLRISGARRLWREGVGGLTRYMGSQEACNGSNSFDKSLTATRYHYLTGDSFLVQLPLLLHESTGLGLPPNVWDLTSITYNLEIQSLFSG